MSVLDNTEHDCEAVRNVFSALLSTTLRYRDDLHASVDVVVTVEDVRTCLGWLVPVLATGNMPLTDSKVRSGLLKLWLKELGKKIK